MMMRLLLVLTLLLSGAPAWAYTCAGSSCTLDLEFTEGVQTANNLKDHVFTFQKTGGPAQTMTIPASGPSGGQKIVTKTPAQTIPPCTTATFTGSLVSRNTAGASSVVVAAPSPTIDRTKDPECTAPAPATDLRFSCGTGGCVLNWAAVTGATQYRVGRCKDKNRCPGSGDKGWEIVVLTTGTSVTVEPPVGLSDYAVFVVTGAASAMYPLRVTVTR